MIEVTGNLFHKQNQDAICITTNGFVKANGECVMGRGCALTVAKADPSIPKILGDSIKASGNHVHYLKQIQGIDILSYPVKPISGIADGTNVVAHQTRRFPQGNTVAGWAMKADINIIERSAHELVKLTNQRGYKKVIIPRMGCGAGELNWNQVREVVKPILDDRFYIITF